MAVASLVTATNINGTTGAISPQSESGPILTVPAGKTYKLQFIRGSVILSTPGPGTSAINLYLNGVGLAALTFTSEDVSALPYYLKAGDVLTAYNTSATNTQTATYYLSFLVTEFA